MSEYWKSTPKYWCKFCKTYVKDTKLEKAQHEATGRHQGNIQRSLRTLHRDNEREEREKQRAKDEVARLNGIVSGRPSTTASSATSNNRTPQPAPAAPRQATADERKLQVQQLADLGVAVPKQFRADMAITGDWETVSERPLAKDTKSESLSHGVHKRKLEEDEEEVEQNNDTGHSSKRKGWGSAIRTYPTDKNPSEDVESLFKSGLERKNVLALKGEENDEKLVKKEEGADDAEPISTSSVLPPGSDEAVKGEDDESAAAPIVFKKRKPKAMKAS